MDSRVGITERGDPALDHSWLPWVREGNAAIIISKNCIVIERLLSELMMPNVIIHCGITGWGGTPIEPNVPPCAETLAAYKRLSEKYGSDRVVLRIDPIIPTVDGVAKAMRVNEHKIGRVRISFLDAYDHIRENMKAQGIYLHKGFHADEDIRKSIWEVMGCPETCAEPGLPSVGCVGEKDCEILGIDPKPLFKGQRPLCPCLANKFELLSKKELCGHKCIYCYWKG